MADARHPGVVLGAFVLRSRLSRGGMGEVWRGEHIHDGLGVAVKVLRQDTADGAVARRSLEQETVAVAALDHPHVARLYDAGRVGLEHPGLPPGAPYLVTELASGGSLDAWCQTPPSWAVLRDAVVDVLAGLAHAHARGLVHRDLKPSNLLLCTEEDVRPGPKVADFGIARSLVDPSWLSGAGTPAYMAPEQRRGAWRDLGPPTDLFALAATVWAWLCGRSPLMAEDGRLRDAWRSLPAFTPRLATPPEVRDWLTWLLHPEPHRRPALAADAASAWPMGSAVSSVWKPDTASLAETGEATLYTGSDPSPAVAPCRPRPALVAWRQAEHSDAGMVAAGLRLFGLRRPRFVGRGDERDRLWRALERVHLTEEPYLVRVTGAAGVGKTFLATWLTERAHEVGLADSVWLHHADGSTDAVGRLLMDAFALGGLDEEAACRRLEARGLSVWQVNALVAAAFDAPDARPQAVVAAVWAWLAQRAAHRPVVCVVDDVQWAEVGCALIRHGLRSGGAPVLFVAIGQSDAREEVPTVAALGGEPGSSLSLELGPLPPETWRRLADALLVLDDALRDELGVCAGGNPQVAVELLSAWVAQGALRATPHGVAWAPGVPAPVVSRAGWVERVEGLLAALGSDDGTCLELAAILGLDVDGDHWAAACRSLGLDPSPSLVFDLARRHLVRFSRVHRASTRHHWSFAHGMIRDALVAHAEKRGFAVRGHQACADALRILGRSSAHQLALALHLVASGREEEAIPLLVQAGNVHHERGNHGRAERVCGMLEEILERRGVAASHEARYAALALRRDLAAVRLRPLDHHQQALEEWVGLHGDPTQRIWVAVRSLSQALDRGAADLPHLESRLEALLDGPCLPIVRSSAWSMLGSAASQRGDLDTARRRHQQALQAALEADRAASVVSIAIDMAFCEVSRQKPDEARRAAQLATERIGEIDRPFLFGSLASVRGAIAELGGSPADAEAHYREALEVFVASGMSLAAVSVRFSLVEVLVGRGQHAEARALLDVIRVPLPAALATARLALQTLVAAADGRQGDVDDLLDILEDRLAARPILHQRIAQLLTTVGTRLDGTRARRVNALCRRCGG